MPIEFTERMKAIARGDDPDAVVETPASEVAGEADPVEQGAETKVPEGESGKEAPASDGSMEAATPEGSELLDKVSDNSKPEVKADWRDDSLKTVAKNYGLTEAELSEFSSKDEFARFQRVMDRQLAGRVRQGRPQEPPVAPVTPTATQPKQSTPAAPTALDPEEYRKKGYDEDTVALVSALAEQREFARKQEERIARAEQIASQNEAQRQLQILDGFADTLDESLFGRTVKDGKPVQLAPEVLANRTALYTAANELAMMNQASGVNMPIPQLLSRAQMVAFGDKILAAEREKVKKDLQAQSNTRRPVGNSRATPGGGVPAKPEDDSIESITSRVLQSWRKRKDAA